MPIAYSILPDRFADDRHGTIERGLEAAGWRVKRGPGMPRGPEDLLVTWTVHRGHKERAARAFEAAGGRVLVCEEAYFREVNGERHFALALCDHNGAGRWPVGGPERWESFGIALEPWRRQGRHVLVREQRGIGSAKMMSPPLWHDDATRRLQALTGRPIVFRAHPKSRMYPETAATQPTLEAALRDCHAVVTWASAIAQCKAGIRKSSKRHRHPGSAKNNVRKWVAFVSMPASRWAIGARVPLSFCMRTKSSISSR